MQQRLPLGEEEGEESGALLALGSITAKRAAGRLELELVEVRPPGAATELDVLLPPPLQAGPDLLRRAGRPRRVGELGGLQAQFCRGSGEWPGQLGDRLPPRLDQRRRGIEIG